MGLRLVFIIMTTTADSTHLRAIVVHAAVTKIDADSTSKLLTDLGHRVDPAANASEAMHLLRSGKTDLLVVDLPAGDETDVLEQLALLPVDHHPGEVAVFSDAASDAVAAVRTRRTRKVHVFFKPLHMHGLLNVLRGLEHRHAQPA